MHESSFVIIRQTLEILKNIDYELKKYYNVQGGDFMNQEGRLIKILEYLNEHKSISVQNICEMSNVSRDTARRDIIKLTEQGVAIRTHGGISLPVIKNAIKAYTERLESYSEEKENIALKALSFVNEDGHYFFDVSTTVRFMAEYINKKVTIATHSLDNIEIISDKEDINVISLGGHLNKKNRFFYKPNFQNYFDGMHFDATFLGAAAIMSDGIYYEDEEDAYIKQAVVKRSKKNIVLADHEKFTCSSYYRGASFKNIDTIITDVAPSAEFIETMEKEDIQLIII